MFGIAQKPSTFFPTTINKFIILMSLIHLGVPRGIEQDVLPSTSVQTEILTCLFLPLFWEKVHYGPFTQINFLMCLVILFYFFYILIPYCIGPKFLALWLSILLLDTNSSLKSLHDIAQMKDL